MKDETNKDLAIKIALAWDKYVKRMSEEERKKIFADYKLYINEYSKFVSNNKF